MDHDAAGIEATGRLTDILREQGYSQITTMQSQYKDWDEDLRAQHNLSAQPAEEHPQLLAAESVCARIAMKCAGIQPDRVLQRLPAMFQFYRTCMEGNKLDTAMDSIEEIAAMSLQVVLRECRQLGADLTITQGGQFLKSRILPHQNRSSLKRRTEEISALIQRAIDQSGAPGIRGEAEKRAIAGAWLDLAISMRSSISWTFSTSCECILSGCILTFHMEIPGYPTLSNGITLHRLSSGGSGGSGSGLAVAVSMKPPIFSAAPLCISLVMCV